MYFTISALLYSTSSLKSSLYLVLTFEAVGDPTNKYSPSGEYETVEPYPDKESSLLNTSPAGVSVWSKLQSLDSFALKYIWTRPSSSSGEPTAIVLLFAVTSKAEAKLWNVPSSSEGFPNVFCKLYTS